ncbi:Serine/threonine-protein kinase nrc-2 [Galdieria sulphuraria]|uniref:non-specific serine/threonine protein kinase n=1 Tax=Galdieria sulphuraria TaxID=130081 RepID=M2XFI4_GALSU|nr:serine/threonine protein kinase [Galdieria sulphuraria]EME28772.1 serine/threonine protein kinase [Galdieria sulphuraria]GJD07120.1 Serine/threonine-protein kinase nrc-2 [Galdieria sulphuraria]|eukprot:XP_005705292.1 serine/threonine protein kinase [Galdieria sulphuraria]
MNSYKNDVKEDQGGPVMGQVSNSSPPYKHKAPEVLARSAVPFSERFPIPQDQVGPQHFTKLKLLGKGAVGKTYLVALKGTDKLYAMKVLTKEEMIVKNKVKRVLTEREILATVNHPFIVTMYASFQTEKRLYFITEYCAGGEFFAVLQRQPKKRLKEEAAKFYAAEVLLALEYLHHMGFIYRDLKPENILMRGDGHLALTDFDLSKQAQAVSPRVVSHQMSLLEKIRNNFQGKNVDPSQKLDIVDSEPVLSYATNSFVGTEEYVAPEVVRGVGHSSSVDWWTLGILIYEMIFGSTPFKGSFSDETFSNIIANGVKFPEDVVVSPECKSLIKKLLKRDPERRLGHENGASDIKRHPWFSNINFALIRNERPPIIPSIPDPRDLSLYASLNVEDDDDDVDTLSDWSSNDPSNPFINFNCYRDEKQLGHHY